MKQSVNLPILRKLSKNTLGAKITRITLRVLIVILALIELCHLIDYYVPIIWGDFIDLIKWLATQNGILVSFACFGFLCTVIIVTMVITIIRRQMK